MSSRSFVAESDFDSSSSGVSTPEKPKFDFSEYFSNREVIQTRTSGLGATAVTATGGTVTYVTMTAAVVGAVAAGAVGVGVGWWLRKRSRVRK